MARRQLARLLAAGLVLLALVASGAAAAAASAPKGELSAGEYQHLRAYQVQTKKAFDGVLPNWRAALRACLGVGESTDLLRSTRADCSAQLTEIHAWLDLHSEKCSGLVLAQLICMDPAFQRLARAVRRLHTTDLRLREVGLARGFTGNCLITLVPTKQQLSTEKTYVGAAKRVAADVAVVVEVAKTSTPGSAMMEQVGNDETALEYARDNWVGATIAYPLSVCPHG